MTLLAVQLHTQTLLDGLTTPQLVAQGLGPANAFVAPPAIVTDTMSDPEIYIWGTEGRNHRQTMPRNQVGAVNWTQPNPTMPALPITTAGFRNVAGMLDVWVMALLPASEDSVTFPMLLDTIEKQFELDLMPIQLTDPNTGDTTWMTHFAEEITISYTTPEETADERTFLYHALFRVAYQEKRQI